MAKQGLTTKNIPNLVKKENSWALCVGSGISTPLFPLWDSLAKKYYTSVHQKQMIYLMNCQKKCLQK